MLLATIISILEHFCCNQIPGGAHYALMFITFLACRQRHFLFRFFRRLSLVVVIKFLPGVTCYRKKAPIDILGTVGNVLYEQCYCRISSSSLL